MVLSEIATFVGFCFLRHATILTMKFYYRITTKSSQVAFSLYVVSNDLFLLAYDLMDNGYTL